MGKYRVRRWRDTPFSPASDFNQEKTMERWKCEWVGSECGHHATYTFYKAVKFSNKFSGFPGLNPLDPASQYYAALYQQQVSAYQHAASAAALSPYGIRPGYPGGHAAAGAGAAGAAAAAELQ